MPGCAGVVIVISALPLAFESASLVAISATTLGCGCACGARYSTTFSEPDGATHGLDAVMQTCPTVGLPFGMPFTVHVTAELDAFETVAVKFALWPVTTVAESGETATVIGGLATIATVALALCIPAVASIATEFGEGTTAGAM